ncbi:MAG: hypothetical protein CL566_09985 [Alphaproteobacteria bacterium]|nr:hypothetical protein [Alphaproteobacteria bacterium]|tara:strand:- start:1096 stop:1500 length:405 start_codon:yes stop_codon:yes gene_type:complete
MSAVGKRLDANGLGQYAETFADNDVTFDLLESLSDDGLRELGLSLGHRKRFAQAIEALGGDVLRRTQAFCQQRAHGVLRTRVTGIGERQPRFHGGIVVAVMRGNPAFQEFPIIVDLCRRLRCTHHRQQSKRQKG